MDFNLRLRDSHDNAEG